MRASQSRLRARPTPLPLHPAAVRITPWLAFAHVKGRRAVRAMAGTGACCVSSAGAMGGAEWPRKSPHTVHGLRGFPSRDREPACSHKELESTRYFPNGTRLSAASALLILRASPSAVAPASLIRLSLRLHEKQSGRVRSDRST